MSKIVHNLIAKTAKEMAHEWYESAAHEDWFYRIHPTMNGFVRDKWRYFIGPARDALVTIMGAQNPDGSYRYPEPMREAAYEAMSIDGQFKGPPASAVSNLIHPASSLLH